MAMPSGFGRKTYAAWRDVVCPLMLVSALALFPAQGLAEMPSDDSANLPTEAAVSDEQVLELEEEVTTTPAEEAVDVELGVAEVEAGEEAAAVQPEQTDAAQVELQTQEVKQGWYDLAGNKTTAAAIPQGANWFDNGVMARSKEVYDRDTDAWYWFDADGICARNKDVYLHSSGGKWVRYDNMGRMIKGEDYRYGAWYYFDPVTGAMAKSWKHLDSSGGKWVYYDPIDGRMATGEKWVTGSGGDGWCYFDENTGALQFGWKYLNSNGGKLVYYDLVNGRMLRGIHTVEGKQCRFNDVTGAYEGEVYSGGSSTPSGTVYWVSSGYAYHSNPGCRSLAHSSNIRSGSVADARALGKTPCRNCYH